MRLERRNNSPPCPEADGGQVGSQLRFNLFCASTIEGTELDTLDAESLEECVELCAFFHPRCDAVTYSSRDRCRLKTNVVPSDTRPSRFVDGAAALYPASVPSTCQDGRSGGFDLFCSNVFNGGDMVQTHQATIDGCMRECSNTSGCAGFSFDAQFVQGFMNCYLKSEISTGGLTGLAGIDSGIVNNAAVVQPQPQPGLAQPPATVIVPQEPATVTQVLPGSTIVVLQPGALDSINPGADPVQNPGFQTIVPGPGRLPVENPGPSTSGGFFFTPAAGAGAVVTGVSTRTLVSLSTSASQVISITQLVTVPVTSFAAGQTGTPQPAGEGGSSSLSWVAAPVVGGIAAVLVAAVMFIMFRKRRARRDEDDKVYDEKSSGAWRWKPSFAPVRNMPNILGGFRLGRPRGTERLDDSASEDRSIPRYEVKAGKMSFSGGATNPLGQHRPMTGLFRSKDRS